MFSNLGHCPVLMNRMGFKNLTTVHSLELLGMSSCPANLSSPPVLSHSFPLMLAAVYSLVSAWESKKEKILYLSLDF